MRERRQRAIAALLIVGLLFLCPRDPPAAAASALDFGFESTAASLSSSAAGAHADLTLDFRIAGSSVAQPGAQPRPWAALRNLVVELPPGLVGMPGAAPRCDAVVFASQPTNQQFCPADTQVGLLRPRAFGQGGGGPYATPLYNLVPPPGKIAQLGAVVGFNAVYISVSPDPDRGDAVSATIANAFSAAPLIGAEMTIWGVPGAASHDGDRFNWVEGLQCGGPCTEPPTTALPDTPFLSNPTRCGPAEVGFAASSYEQPEELDRRYAPLPEITDCEAVPFEPRMKIAPTTSSAAAPGGLDVVLEVPQASAASVPASAAVRTAHLVLPPGLTFDASGTAGLDACSEEAVGAARNERQIVDVGGGGAPLVLSVAGETTSQLPEFASAAEVRAALEALPAVGPGAVKVSGRAGGPWAVEFTGPLAGRDVQPLAGTLTEMQRLSLSGATGGYKLGFSGHWTAPLPLGASASAVQTALEQLPGLGPGQVRVLGGPITGTPEGTSQSFDLAFGGGLTGVDVPEIEAAASPAAPDTAIEVVEVAAGGASVSTHTVDQGGELRFSAGAAGCPPASQVADGTLLTPLVDDPLSVRLYLARQNANPYGSLFAGYLLAEGDGIRLTLPARFTIDPDTGQVSMTVENPTQLPLAELRLHFKGGDRGLFATPFECGTYAATYRLDPSSGGPPASGESGFTLDRNCGPHAFDPSFRAGSGSARAGAFTSFLIELLRPPGSPPLTQLAVNMPEGLTAGLAGVARCPDAALEQLPTAPGAGASELASPACPAASRVGTVTAGIGAGLTTYMHPGGVYLAGPYRGAPLSLVLAVPALAGPFDLGNLMVRAAVSVDPSTAQMSIDSDTIPTVLAGIPLELRDLRVSIDRPGFLTNPTSCEEQAVTGATRGGNGATVPVSEPFQVGDCAGLPFKPRARLSFSGGVGRNGHPRLAFMLAPRRGDANLAAAALTLPVSQLIDLRRLPTLCPRSAAPSCPPRSRLGSISLRSPLLGQPFRGTLYAGESGHGLPEVSAVLRSGGFRLVLRGRSSARSGRLSIRIPSIPDMPFSRLRLALDGGRRGFIVNSEPLCGRAVHGTVALRAHNGRRRWLHPEAVVDC
jgi:hypothetical protein